MELVRKSKKRGYRETVISSGGVLPSTVWGATREADRIKLRFDGDDTASYHLSMSRKESEYIIALLRNRLDSAPGAY